MKNFIKCEEAKDIFENENVVVVDTRFDLFDPLYGEKAYKNEHIKGAYFLDINKNLSGEKGIHGGARPVPEVKDILRKLSKIGAYKNSKIIIYDDKMYSSPRCFWQLKYLGYEDVKILEGGIERWKSLGYPVNDIIPKEKEEVSIEASLNDKIYCDGAYIMELLENGDVLIADSRAEERFTGEYEPLYSKKGHIKGSVNIHWLESVNEDGTIKDMDYLKDKFKALNKYSEIIFYCGSAIEGAINFAVFDEMGYKTRLYVGSMSDWITYDNYPVETGKGVD